jgi:ABC-type nitrate/sulfonate/bicarbonate transport system substrate-binding protein
MAVTGKCRPHCAELGLLASGRVRAKAKLASMRRSTFVLATAAVAAMPSLARAQTLAPIRISVFPGETSAQAYYAKELGLFAKNGLDASITELRNGAASAAAVAGGSTDIGFSNGLSLAQGHERGVPFTILAPAALSVAGKGTNAILVVGKTSPIRTGKDLDGTSMWFAMSDWAAKNPDLVRRFDIAMKQAAVWGNTHPNESAVIVADHIKQPVADIEAANRAIYGTDMTPDLLQPVIDASAKYGSLKAAFPARELIFVPSK